MRFSATLPIFLSSLWLAGVATLAESPVDEEDVEIPEVVALDQAEPLLVDFAGWQPRIDWSAKKAGIFSGFFDFVGGNPTELAKMTHPFYRHRIHQVSDNWGPLYYEKTRYSRTQGIRLASFLDQHVKISLAQCRFHYGELLGSLWSSRLDELVLETNSGILGNETLFSSGKSYLLELSLHF